MKKNKLNRLATMLGMGALTGAVPLAAVGGFFKPENAFVIAVLFMAGPGSIATAILLDGDMKTRMLVALCAGLIATLLVVLSAGVGTTLLSFLNLKALKIAGGIAVLLIGLMIMGVKIPENLPLGIMLFGIVLGGILK